jgi:hypothetical protein
MSAGRQNGLLGEEGNAPKGISSAGYQEGGVQPKVTPPFVITETQ